MKPKQISAGQKKTFEVSEWILRFITDIIHVAVIYRPPYSEQNKVSITDFIAEFSSYLENIITTPHKLVIGGDFNIHVEDAGNSDANKFCDLLESMNLRNHVWSSTHVSGHVLDLIITRNDDSIILNSAERRYFISDHAFIRTHTTLIKPKTEVKEIEYRKLKDIDLSQFKEDIRASELMDMKDKSVHEKAIVYDRILRDILDSHAPVVKKIIKIKKGSPWYNHELKELKREKRRKEDKWLRSGKECDHRKFKEVRLEYIRSCNTAKTKYYTNEVLKCEGDQKKIYRLISNLTDGENIMPYPDCDSESELCENFNKFFVEKIDKIMCDIDNTIKTENLTNLVDYEAECDSSCLEFSNFKSLTTEEVGKLIIKSKTTSCNLDPIPTDLVKKCMDVLLNPISDIVNSSLQEGSFPDSWKCAVVTPLIKKKGMDLAYKSYRPVSNLPFLSKVIEKAGLNQYVDHVECINKFSTQNSAYKKHHSTETLLLKIHSDLMNNMDKQKVTLLVLLDLSAAFDTVSLDILSQIFKYRFNIQGGVLSWFQTYLSDRKQRVMINNTISEMYSLKYGVPQGSCAGPVAFLGYLSSMYDIVDKRLPMIGGYADDHQLYLAFNPGSQQNEMDAIQRLEACIADIRTWMLTHRLKINDSKTEFLLFGTKQQLEKVNISEIKVS